MLIIWPVLNVKYLLNQTQMKTTILFILSIALLSCEKPDVPKGTPRCVVNKIRDFSKSSDCDGIRVDEYTFQGNTVYTFDPGNCGADMTTEVVNSDCKTLGYLGGISANTMINGEDFTKATYIKKTWSR